MAEKSTVMYARTINLGNYNSERIEVKLTIDEGQDEEGRLETAYQMVKKQAMDKHGEKINDNGDLPC